MGQVSIRCGTLLGVLVGGFRCLLQLIIYLLEKLLGFLRMAPHIPFIGLLSGQDFFISLGGESLGCCQIGMTLFADIVPGSLSKNCPAA
jgi:hypothetical protein